jgi:transglutaminase-like putative cysteine protease
MQYRVTHKTTYEYAEHVSLCQNLAHVIPREVPWQHCIRSTLSVRPEPAVLSPRTDYFGNPATFFTVQVPHRQLLIAAEHVVELTQRPTPDPAQTPPWETVRNLLTHDCSPDVLAAYQFACTSRYTPIDSATSSYALPSFPARRPLLEAVLDLTRRIHKDIVYDPRATNVATPLEQILAKRRGVCQDFAHLELACLRSLGLPARYVSGYLCSTAPPGQTRLVGADATHAWLSIWCPGMGWVDIDPTNNQIPTDKHILLAWGRDFADVSPIKGVILGGGAHSVRVGVDVVRL